MSKKLLLSVMLLLLLVLSCKKDPDNIVSPSRSFDFKASASTPLTINISVIRPTSSTPTNIDVIGLINVTGAYEYTPMNVEAGDKVVITVKTAQNQPINSSLTINGLNIAFKASSLNDVNGVSSVSWDMTVD